jgi:hypothetical protein
MMEGPGADSEEKHEPVSDIDTVVVVVGLKALDPEWPIREAIDPLPTCGFENCCFANRVFKSILRAPPAIGSVVDNKAEATHRRGDLLHKRHGLMANWEAL